MGRGPPLSEPFRKKEFIPVSASPRARSFAERQRLQVEQPRKRRKSLVAAEGTVRSALTDGRAHGVAQPTEQPGRARRACTLRGSRMLAPEAP